MIRTPHRPSGHARRGALAAVALLAVPLAAVTAASLPATAATAPAVRLAGSVVTPPAGSTVLGPADGSAHLTVEVTLAPRDPAALTAFVTAVSTPGGPRYHRYLSAGRFAATFGPTTATVDAARRWLASTGLSLGATTADGLAVPVSGTTAQVEAAFATPLVRTRLPSGRTARLAARDPQVPGALAGRITGVLGLGDQMAATPRVVRAAPRAAAPSGPAAAVTVAGPQACPEITGFTSGWTATELARTYGLSTLYAGGRTGAGQTVGIFELEPFSAGDIAAYQACYGTSVPVTTVTVDGGATGSQEGEAALDIEVVAGLAPGAAVRVYSGPNNDGNGPIDTYRTMVTQDAAAVLTTSWGQCEPLMDPATRVAESVLFAEAATQGQTVLAASGDTGSSDCWSPVAPGSTGLAVDDPSDQPDVTGVGGTTLTSTAADAPVEAAWNSEPEGRTAAGGGGNSATFVAPAYQQVASARSTDTASTCDATADQQCRQVPDVSATADPAHGDIVFWAGSWWTFGGTSQASPLWAALVADTDQGCASPAGLLGPALYGPAGPADVHDVTAGTNALFGGSQYTARAGYDLATGWGSPRADALLGLFSGDAAGCPTVTSVTPASGPAVGGTTVTVTGTGFGTGTPVVDVGGAAAQVVASSPTSVTVVTPDAVYGGPAAVTVTTTGTAAGTSPVVAASHFTYTSPSVTSVGPARGPTSGGGAVTVEGTGFTHVSGVTFGTVATTFRVTSPTSLTADVPPGPTAGGSVTVHVTSDEGTSPSGPGSAYAYALPGYLLAASDGGVFTYGAAGFHGSGGDRVLSAPVVATAMAPGDTGYWMAGADGSVLSFGTAVRAGSAAGTPLAHPVVGMAGTPDGQGYWLVASDGGVFAYGDARFYGSAGALTLRSPVVGMAPTPDGRGYWLVAADGGIFSYGDADFHGSAGNLVLNRPVVGMAATPDGRGYWLVATDGGIFSYGDAAFHGSAGNVVLNRPVVGMTVTLDGRGYWLVATDGGIFSYGTASFLGSTGNLVLNRPVVGMAAT